MHLLKRFFDFYVFSNIHVSLGVYFFVKITLLSYGIYENTTALFCFFSTIISYNFIRFLDVSNNKSWLAEWYSKQKLLLFVLTCISGVSIVYLSFSFRFEALLILIPFFVLTFFYGMRLPRKLISLRRVPGLKIFLIAFCFAGVTVLFPLVQNKIEIGISEWWYFFQRLFFVILITLPFDIRDVDFDSGQLKTIPQQLGVFYSKMIGVLIAVSVLLIELLLMGNLNSNFIIVLIVIVLSIVLLLFSVKKQSIYFSAFWVESLPIIWCLLLLGLNL